MADKLMKENIPASASVIVAPFPGRLSLTMGLWLCWTLSHASPLYADAYLNSAHGNTTYGVNRSFTSSKGYAKANCAHCHEQHACIEGSDLTARPYALFSNNFVSQLEDFCFDCHKGAGSLQVAFSRQNYNYSYWFGGDTIHHLTPNNIYDTFNPPAGSAHNLQDILNFAKAKWPETFKDESNPCSTCHNPHLSTRAYPLVRPVDRGNLWGDEAGEWMSDYAAAHGGRYQAPYRSGGGYEPDGSATTDGSNLPDYVTFCSDCHNATNTIWSSTLLRNLKNIDWTQQNQRSFPGDYHGGVTRCNTVDGMAWGSLKNPYYTSNYANFILSCTDCHEPHGSVFGQADATPYLLRKTVNGHYNKVPPGPGPWTWQYEFCNSCHVNIGHCGGPGSCLNCHFHNAASKCWASWQCGGPFGAAGNSF